MSQSLFVCTQINGFKCYYLTLTVLHATVKWFHYNKWLNSSIWLIVRTLTVTTTQSQSGAESNENEGVYSPNTRTGASPSDCLVSYPGLLFVYLKSNFGKNSAW